MNATKTGFQMLPGAVESHVYPALEWGVPMVGVLQENWDWVKKIAARADVNKTTIFYKDLPDWGLWFDTLQNLPTEDAVTAWIAQAKKRDDSLRRIIGWANDRGHRPVVGAFGELDWRLLINPVALRKFADFERARAYRLWGMDASASLFKFNMGTINPERVDHIDHALDVCRGPDAIAFLCVDEFAPIWLTTWMGPNQTDTLEDGASREDKFNALLGAPHLDFSNPAAWRPAWLIGRPWGIGNRNAAGTIVSYGIPKLYDVQMMVGELGVDAVDNPDIPRRLLGRLYDGWWTCKGEWTNRLGYPNEQSGLQAALELLDDFYLRLRLPNGDLQVKHRMWFGGGPGHHWKNYDLFYTDQTVRMYNQEYGPAALSLPPAVDLSETPTPTPLPPPIDVPPGNIDAVQDLIEIHAQLGIIKDAADTATGQVEDLMGTLQ